MFYNLNLDDRSYREIEAEAVFTIPGKCPDWTNYNQSDPGILLLGLLAWLKEIQQYRISRLGGWKRQKYLKLFGVCMNHIRPATGFVSVEQTLSAKKGMPMPKGTRFFAEEMAFETIKKQKPYPIRLIGACILSEKTLERYVNVGSDLEKQMRLYPFGEQPKAGNSCCFVMDRGFDSTGQTIVSFDIHTEYEVARNPIGEDFIPLAKLCWEYQSKDGWEALTVDFDTTYAFLQSGKIGFSLTKEMVEDISYQAFLIRVTLKENDYDVAPLIHNIYFNQIEVRQQYSYCDYEDYEIMQEGGLLSVKSGMYLAKSGQTELYLKKDNGYLPIPIVRREKAPDGDSIFYFERPRWAARETVLLCRIASYEGEFWDKRIPGIGDGFANQEYRLNISDIVCDEFEIMVCDRADGMFYPYRRVEDFDSCKPKDGVYLFDTAENRLLFANCENGAAPDGEIKILRLRTSGGKAGNIKAGRINDCPVFPDLLVRQDQMTQGGRDNETIEECYERLRRRLKQIGRCVTYADYEEMAKQTPGLLISDSKVIPPAKGQPDQNENEISIVVRFLSYKERDDCMSSKYRQNLEQMFYRRKMIGTSVKILNPEYVGVSVFAEIVIWPQFGDAEEQIEEAVRVYLDEKSWEFGKTVSVSAIYGIIDILPCVRQASSLSIEARGRGVRHLSNGDVKLPQNGLPYLKDLDFRIFTSGSTISP